MTPAGGEHRSPGVTRRWSTPLGIGLATVTLALLVLIPVVGAWNAADGLVVGAAADPSDFLLHISPIGFLVVGAFLAVRRPRNTIGWLLCVIALSFVTAVVADQVALRHVTIEDLGAAGELATWLSFWAPVLGSGLIPFFVLVFPSGSIASTRWRRIATVAAVALALLLAASAVRPTVTVEGTTLTNPVGIAPAAPLLDFLVAVLGVALGTFGIIVVADLVRRLRRSSGVERQQLRWFVAAALLLPVMVAVALAGSQIVVVTLGFDAAWGWFHRLVVSSFFVSFNGMALAIGIAVLRHRLYEIDRIISRTVTYGLVVAVLGAVYVTGVVGLGAVVSGFAGERGGDLVVAASVLAVVALFRPVRTRVQQAVDRRFNRSGYEARLAVKAVAQRLREEVELDAITRAVAETAAVAVQPEHVSLWLDTQRVDR